MNWVEGLPETARRPWTDAERASTERLLARARSRRRRFLLGWLAVPALLVGSLMFETAFRGEWFAVPVQMVVFLGTLLLLLPVLLLSGRDARARERALKRDLGEGTVVEYGAGERSIVHLPESRVVVAASGVSCALGDRAYPWPYAPGDPFDPEAGPLPDDAFDQHEERRLSDAERMELRALAAKRRRVSAVWVAFLVVWFLGVASVLVREGPSAGRILFAVVWSLAALFSWVNLRGARRVASALLADAEAGVVHRITQGPIVGYEILPTARQPWSGPHGPSPWRTGVG